MIDWFARNTCVDIVTTKSIELEPNPGNREPVITEPEPGCYGNAVGLRNPGVEVSLDELSRLRVSWEANPPSTAPLLNVSLSASSAADFVRLAERLAPVADLFELNLSCPHAASGYGAAIGSDPCAIDEVTRAVVSVTDLPVFVKLTPNVASIGAMASAALDAGAGGIVAINTVGPEVYVEPNTGQPVLNSPPDGRGGSRGRGGMSGRWVRSRALAAVKEIRDAAGPDVPLIGMGGVDSREACVAMCKAGADAVGIGSALGGMHQREWPAFFERVAGRTAVCGDPVVRAGPACCRRPTGQPVLRRDTRMGYGEFRVTRNRRCSTDIAEIELNGLLTTGAGQAVFAWLPGTGEKPLAPAAADPLTFLVKEKGPFTRALAGMSPGAAVYVRGPYGERTRAADVAGRVLMVAAGTGLAAVSILAGELVAAGRSVSILLGMRDCASPPLMDREDIAGITRVVPDNGKEGRVLDLFEADIERCDTRGLTVMTAGPEAFMDRATRIAASRGVDGENIVISLEETMLCGIGLCGACDCGGQLTCQYGTFVSASDLYAGRTRLEECYD